MNKPRLDPADRDSEISPPVMLDTRDAVRARQGVVSGRVVLVLIVSTCLGVIALAAAYWLS
jgi:hypothetical protein